MMLERARFLDAGDPLREFRDRFMLPDGVIYLDGNSLGCLPKATPARLEEVVREEWGRDLIRSWNTAGWIDLPARVGAKIAPLIGARPHEVIACDSTSVNLFKLISAALAMQPGRKVVLSEPGNFPTDLYMIDGLERQGLAERRLAERGVRFIQLYHQGWDQHGGLPGGIRGQCRETDQASSALVADLKRRGMLEDTLVIWGGEFGRTSYCQGKLAPNNYGRDHHPRCFSMWLAGGGVRGGTTYGRTDPFSYNIAENPVHIHDLHATILYLMGIDHERLTFKYQGRQFRLTDVHGKVIHDLLA